MSLAVSNLMVPNLSELTENEKGMNCGNQSRKIPIFGGSFGLIFLVYLQLSDIWVPFFLQLAEALASKNGGMVILLSQQTSKPEPEQ